MKSLILFQVLQKYFYNRIINILQKYFSDSNKKTSGRICGVCGKSGHNARTCPENSNNHKKENKTKNKTK